MDIRLPRPSDAGPSDEREDREVAGVSLPITLSGVARADEAGDESEHDDGSVSVRECGRGFMVFGSPSISFASCSARRDRPNAAVVASASASLPPA